MIAAMFGFTVGALFGWHYANERAERRLRFWREEASKLQDNK
jgi:hypothetical protein